MRRKLSDVANLVTRKVRPEGLSYSNYISTDSMKSNLGGVEFGKSNVPTGKATLYKPGDVLFSNIRTYFRKVWRANCFGSCSNDVLVFQAATDRIDEQFLYYVLANKDFTEYSFQTSKGVKMPRGDKTALLLYELDVPSLSEQREIAAILGMLDDKIELNRKTAATLEEMARALYGSWFVDFDPVHAKAKGRAPAYMDAETAALFPDKFDEDGVPEGWSMKRLGDLLTLNYGKALTKELRVPGGYPVYGSGGADSTHIEALIIEPTIIVGRKGTVGSLRWAPKGCWPIDTVFYVTTTKPLSFILRTLQEMPLAEMNTDAAVPGLNRENVYRLEVAFPNAKILGAFDSMATAWQQRVDTLTVENQTLASLRDTLLPRLMSGELRVPAALEMINEVA